MSSHHLNVYCMCLCVCVCACLGKWGNEGITGHVISTAFSLSSFFSWSDGVIISSASGNGKWPHALFKHAKMLIDDSLIYIFPQCRSHSSHFQPGMRYINVNLGLIIQVGGASFIIYFGWCWGSWMFILSWLFPLGYKYFKKSNTK